MIPIVWLVGTSGVGKSTVGWQLQQALERRNVPAAFVDADQLRNAAGVQATEDEFIADGLAVLGPIFQRAGATILIVAGMVDDAAHLARLLPVGGRPPVLVVHLHASDETVVDRVEQRRWNVELAADSVKYAHSFDATWVDVAVDTTCQSPSQVAGTLLEGSERLARSERLDTPLAVPPVMDTEPTVTLITGAGGVGLSTTGFLAFLQRMWSGERTGYVDSYQVGILGADPRAPEAASLRAANSAALAAVMARRGIRHVLITADPLTARALTAIAKPAHLFWLDASDDVIESRHRARAAGGGPPLAADHRLGLDDLGIRAAVAASIAEARAVGLRPNGATIINTDELSAEDVARQINQCGGVGVNL
ncbi:AAA family ATPase [Arthrobacter sp. R4-81]